MEKKGQQRVSLTCDGQTLIRHDVTGNLVKVSLLPGVRVGTGVVCFRVFLPLFLCSLCFHGFLRGRAFQ
jgi:hypothetical protein